ncbi:MAG: hypothetical protein HY296_00635 [Thaumarchaeota archaeon]|nr:hypothetical protein [Nitrososphaerota archaeon]
MDPKTPSAMVFFASGLYLMFGFLSVGALATMTTSYYYFPTVSAATWVEVGLSVILSFLVLVSGLLIGSKSPGRIQRGSILGFVASTAGVLDAMALMSINLGYTGILIQFLPIGGFALFFLGYPLTVTGSIASLLTISKPEEPSTNPP